MQGPAAIVELKVRSMEHGILAALTEHEANIQKEIRSAVSSIVKSFDFAGQIEREATYLIRQELTTALQEILRPKVKETISKTLEEVLKNMEKKPKK
jgi:hypothetical protein